MPIHDWTRVDHGTFHHFHVSWTVALNDALNSGSLPPDYYALVEQHADAGKPDLITLHGNGDKNGSSNGPSSGLATVALAPPLVRFHEKSADEFSALRRTVTIRHQSGGEVVAIIEIVSPGNKSSRNGIQAFVEKVASAIRHGVHVLVIDLFPPGRRDPNGIHPLIWDTFGDSEFHPPSDKPLTLASYCASPKIEAFVEPVAVGDVLPAMPLFLAPGEYITAPLEPSYTATWNRLPRPIQKMVDG